MFLATEAQGALARPWASMCNRYAVGRLGPREERVPSRLPDADR